MIIILSFYLTTFPKLISQKIMLITMSPAKLLNTSQPKSTKVVKPLYEKEALELNELLKNYSIEELRDMMSMNTMLAKDTYEYVHQFGITDALFTAVSLYNGVAYQALNFESLSTKDKAYGNEHLKILSGLYGMLNPLDTIYPYRLEMQTLLQNEKGDTLYDFWKETLTAKLVAELKQQNTNIWLNLASKEYTKVIDKKKLPKGTTIITPVFKETIGDKQKQIVVYVKKARGLMARFVIEKQIDSLDGLKTFDSEGYTFSETLSNDKEWVFLR